MQSIRLNLSALDERLKTLNCGDVVSLHGKIYTMRDAGHMRTLEYLRLHSHLPFGLAGKALFYAGPTAPVNGRPFGAIGPTTASRMDFATPALMQAGIKLTLGKGVRSKEVVEACVANGCVYLATTGGAAAYLAQFVVSASLVAWEDLGAEALFELELDGLPAIVAIDTYGKNLYDRQSL